VVRSFKNAKERGAYTIAITSHKGSPLSEIADIVLYTTSQEVGISNIEPSYESVLQLVLLDCLYMVVYMEMLDKATKFIEITADEIENVRIK